MNDIRDLFPGRMRERTFQLKARRDAGADIPVNRGQLAWLIWGAKGAPEPENQPAFTDVSEPEMAKAAQWCVEQGILTAPGETTFRPNGWVTRVKVIQTWNTAFPKQ